jgi:oligopeptide transport system substrate-binding protein
MATKKLEYSKRNGMRVVLAVLMCCVLWGGFACRRRGEEGDKVSVYAAILSKVRGMDPGDIGDTTSSKVVGNFFECLYQYDYLKRPYELIPMLAESMPEVSEGGLTYTVKIKKGVYFHDSECFEGGKGRELVAGDFVYAWKRIANIKYRSKNWWMFDDKIVGLDEFREYTKDKKLKVVDYSREVAGLLTPDDHTLVIKLKKPWPQIIFMLAHFPASWLATRMREATAG